MSRLTTLLRKLRARHPRPGEKLVFLHLMKTGGTALHVQLAGQFASERIFPGRLPGLESSLRQFGADYDFFSGHFNAAEVDLIPGPKYLMTVLRDPAERLISLYYFFRRQPPEVLADAPSDVRASLEVSQTHDLLGFLRHKSSVWSTDNSIARMLAGDVSAEPYEIVEGGRRSRLSGADVLERAIATLERFQVVGFTDSLDDAYRAVAGDWGFPPVKRRLPRCNTRHEDLPHLLKPVREEPITPAIEAEIARLTVLDRQVMAHARAMQDERFHGFRRAA